MSSLMQAQGLCKSFSTANGPLDILRELSFDLGAGQTMAIVGRSGSGKSTLLSLLGGLDRPDQGDIVFDGSSLFGASDEELTRNRSKNIGIIFQQFHLLEHLSALENVELALEISGASNVRERALSALSKVGLAERAHHLPSTLSGGECQRVAVARSLAQGPKLLLADEPSGSLDVDTGASVMNLVFDLVESEGMSLILVTHSPELASRCERVYQLVEGALKEEERVS